MLYKFFSILGILSCLVLLWCSQETKTPINQDDSSLVSDTSDTTSFADASLALSGSVIVESNHMVTLTGYASQSWFFEGTFPIELVDQDGNTLSQGSVQTSDDWTTTPHPYFMGELSYSDSAPKQATLILRNDNPSGLPENEVRYEIPLTLR